MQHEIASPRPLLDERGHLVEEGWARHPHWRYHRDAVHAGPLRIKEWDYYSVLSHDGRFGITFTMSDLGYMGLFAICFLDFERRYYDQVESMTLLPLGTTGLSPDSDGGEVAFSDGTLGMRFTYRDGTRRLTFNAPGITNADGSRGLTGAITLAQPEDLESTVIATSWAEKRTAFYYNRKINCMPASGGFTIGTDEYRLDPGRDFGGLDWGRGTWTYKNRWFWGSASGLVEGRPFGFNIGYGFSDRTPASENTLLYDGRIHKLQEVTFHYDEADYLKPWRFTSSDGRFEMGFVPLVDRQAAVDFKLLKSIQHQVFGLFSGVARLDDGTTVELRDFLGFAEDVLNWW